MTKEKTKEEILKKHTELAAGCSVKYNITGPGILDAMEEYANQFRAWVPVSERLPEENDKGEAPAVVVKYTRDSVVHFDIGYYYPEQKFWCNENCYLIYTVTDWLPIPEPPQTHDTD